MSEFKVYVVDDDELLREMLDAVLSPQFTVSCFDSSEALLARMESEKPKLIVLDVGLPGMDGYACCRSIRENYGSLPVVFLSGHDTIDARLEGYDAGGDDFIVKPCDAQELIQKLKVFERLAAHETDLAEQIESSEQLSSLVLASMDESGLVLQFLAKAIACETPHELAEALLHLMRGYRLAGGVQTRCDGEKQNIGAEGENRPLESSVLDHVSTLGRLFEFKNRSVFNFERVTLMIVNMPVSDSDFCGRIRDNLTMALQGADARLAALEAAQIERRKQSANQWALQSIKATIAELSEAQQKQRFSGATITQELQEALLRSFVHLGLTESQEQFIGQMVQGYLDQLIAVFDQGADTQTMLGDVLASLESAQ